LPLEDRLGAQNDGECPHCRLKVCFVSALEDVGLGEPRTARPKEVFTARERLQFDSSQCPSCKSLIAWVGKYDFKTSTLIEEFLVWPYLGQKRAPIEATKAVSHIAKDFESASRLVNVDANASAAISRRCLQSLLKEAAKTSKRDLADQIDEVLSANVLPSQLAENLDAVRQVGNFAAHVSKSQVTGLVVDAEPGEAEWNLEVLEGLFDYYYVQPEKNRLRREALNAKLTEIGKPQLKKP